MATTIERKERPLSIQKKELPPKVFLWHVAGLVVVGCSIVFFTIINFFPIFTAPEEPKQEIKLKEYNLTPWRGVVNQHGARLKPFETSAQEMCRLIYGRNKVLGQDSVAVVLSWMLEGHPKAVDRISPTWEDKEFILCEHEEIRKFVFLLQKDATLADKELKHEQVHGKYMSPKQLREFIATYVHLKQARFGKLRELTSHLPEDELHAVERRFNLYEAIRNPKVAESNYLGAKGMSMGERDPFAFVALDKVPGSPWFSIGQLRVMVENPEKWFEQIKERVRDVPQLYLSQEHKDALVEFQKKILHGQASATMKELAQVMEERRDKVVAEYASLREKKDAKKAEEVLKKAISSWAGFADAAKKPKQETLKVLGDALKEEDVDAESVSVALGDFLKGRDQAALADLEQRLPAKILQYSPAKPEFRMLHLGYLEMRYPDMYEIAFKWQDPPLDSAKKVLASFDELCFAYDSNDAGKFDKASQDFFAVVAEVSVKEAGAAYPGEDDIAIRLGHLLSGESIGAPSPQLIDLELTFNSVKPFMWAWILMLGSLLLFTLSLGLNSRLCYIGGFTLYGVSLAFQLFGFFTRIIVSGRPPVTNMYETVIWVAFMTGIFALILESIYRRKVIALAGAFVATLGLVLADQLPLALDPKITSLVPVLRSNFWLTIHVLTIVSSYAAGALAWALGNIALVLIVFSHANARETIKVLSNFTYRALQIAVLLLAAGTFLGGWWAAYSWGRFWGWDPKETGALIALVAYVIPLHMRFIGWIKDFGLAVAAIVCFAFIMFSWYGINFVVPAGLHAYAFGGGGAGWVYWAAFLNIEWVLVASLIFQYKKLQPAPAKESVAVQPA